jgi:plasmid stability protein
MPSLQVRNVPDDALQKLKERAAAAGQSLSEYSLALLLRSLERPTRAELWARIKSREPVDLPISAADIIREERGPLP